MAIALRLGEGLPDLADEQGPSQRRCRGLARPSAAAIRSIYTMLGNFGSAPGKIRSRIEHPAAFRA
jgi:hypothetical protein